MSISIWLYWRCTCCRNRDPGSPHHEPISMGNKHATWKCGFECLCACASVCLRLLCALCACVPCPRTINIVIDTYSLYAYKGVLLSASSSFNLEGPIRWRMGWPRVAGRGGPRHALMMVVICSNTMFYVDRLHKIVAAQCACCSDFLGNAMRLFST